MLGIAKAVKKPTQRQKLMMSVHFVDLAGSLLQLGSTYHLTVGEEL